MSASERERGESDPRDRVIVWHPSNSSLPNQGCKSGETGEKRGGGGKLLLWCLLARNSRPPGRWRKRVRSGPAVERRMKAFPVSHTCARWLRPGGIEWRARARKKVAISAIEKPYLLLLPPFLARGEGGTHTRAKPEEIVLKVKRTTNCHFRSGLSVGVLYCSFDILCAVRCLCVCVFRTTTGPWFRPLPPASHKPIGGRSAHLIELCNVTPL